MISFDLFRLFMYNVGDMDTNRFYAKLKKMQFTLCNGFTKKGKVVFVGDSLTQNCDLKKFYPTIDSVNRGIGGDTLQWLFLRTDCSIFNLKPKAIVFLMGINDLNFYGASVEDMMDRYTAFFSLLQKKCKDTPVIVQSLYPVITEGKTKYPMVKGIKKSVSLLNEYLERLCENYGYIFVNVYEKLECNGQLDEKYSKDCLHLNDEGYEVVAELINEKLGEVLID